MLSVEDVDHYLLHPPVIPIYLSDTALGITSGYMDYN